MNKKMKNKYKIIIAIGILSIAGLISSVVAQKKSAIGVRIMANREHLPARRWYENQNFLKKGNPAPILVDGYDGIKDGNTVYVNAMNILHPDIFGPFYCEKNGLISAPGNVGKCEDEANKNPNFFTNIYVISYTEDAANQTIFNQVISNWKFNSNINLHTPCAGCNGGQAEVDAARAEIRRDTRRLADMAYMHWVFEKFYNAYGYYPKLDSGTYIQNETLSRWPSWQETLGAELGITLQVDPINSFGVCAGNNQGCYCLDHDPETCWNEKTRLFNGARSFKTNLPAGTGLPAGAKVYYYKSYGNGASYEFNASGWESPYIGGDYVGTMQAGHTAGNTKPYVYPVEAVNIAPDEEKIIQLYAYDNDKFTGRIIWDEPTYKGTITGADNSCDVAKSDNCCFELLVDDDGNLVPPITILDNTGKPDEYTGGKFRSYRNLKIKANETDGVCQGKIILRVSDDGIQSAGSSPLLSDTLVIDVRVRNIAPYISGVSKLKGIVGVDFGEAQVLGQDSPGDVLTYEWRADSKPPGLAMSDTGAITGTPEKEGNFNVGFKVRDESGAVSAEYLATISILNNPPVFATGDDLGEVKVGFPWSATISAHDNTPYSGIDGLPHPHLPLSFTFEENFEKNPEWIKFDYVNSSRNYVFNPSFENGLEGYYPIESNCAELAQDNANRSHGSYSGRVKISGSIQNCIDASPDYDNYNHVYGIYQDVNTGSPLGGKKITGSVSVKAPAGKDVSLLMFGIGLLKTEKDEAGNIKLDNDREPIKNWADNCCQKKSITGNGNWQRIVVPWIVPSAILNGSSYEGSFDGSGIHFRLSYEQQGVSGDVVYWDSLQLIEGEPPAGALPDWMENSEGIAKLSGTPREIREHSFKLRVEDSKGKAASKVFRFTAKNQSPIITSPPIGTVSVRTTADFSRQITAIDPDGHSLKYEISNNTGVEILKIGPADSHPAGEIFRNFGLHNPAENYSITVSVGDSYGATTTQRFTLRLKSFCGDGIQQDSPSNLEKLGGPKNDGKEDCDGMDGTATPADSSQFKQYSCSDSCVFKGGWCGDNILQNGENGTVDQEKCDGNAGIAASPADSSKDKQYGCNSVSCVPEGGYCGDGNTDSSYEECDYGGNLNCCDTCAWTCPVGGVYEFKQMIGVNSNFLIKESGEYLTIDFPACRIFKEGTFLIDAKIIEPSGISGADIIFATDSSGSIGGDMESIKTSLNNALDILHNSLIAGEIKVALVEFDGSIRSTKLENIVSEAILSSFKSTIGEYAAGGGTATGSAMNKSVEILNNNISSGRDKIIILLSDGQPSDSPDNAITTAKISGIKFYTIAFGNALSDANLENKMCGWSSDNGTDCYAKKYSYMGDSGDINSIYNSIIVSIEASLLPSNPKMTRNGKIVNLSYREPNYNIYNIDLSQTVNCSELSSPLKYKIEYGGGGKIEFFNARVNYCPACSF